MSYNFYHTWHRFNPPNYRYTTDFNVSDDHADKALLLNYHEAVEKLNGYIINELIANDKYARNPEGDGDATQAALKKFEATNSLFPDGKLDALTLDALIF
ncbi:MAG: hypothetical protein ACJAX3_002757 [Patiriisocius sp.]|jgi:hypothetical protein